jgi:hypothetical protein
MKTKANLIPNLDHETRKQKQKHDMCETIIQ